ncbi:MAG: DEAD/DEAH box helicase family protein [Bacteroidaceae bacterium]|nr:DEAD/DEAH box helicase family protein [Bacteroidaceae bacterium]
MMDATRIHSFNSFVRMMYAYSTPEIARHDGWLKIGDTEQGVHKRIGQQTHTADVVYNIVWKDIAMYRDDCTFFRDYDFHDYLTEYKGIERNDHTEWFKIDGDALRRYFEEFASRDYQQKGLHYSYKLRDEQQRAVEMTQAYLEAHHGEGKFLWNAKPRFGKTLTAYDLIRQMKAKNVLIVTNRPSIANSWYDDFEKYMAGQTGYCFVSDNESLRDRPGVMTRDMFVKWPRKLEKDFAGQICFESLQGLKGSVYFGGNYNKLEWIKNLCWDVLIVDESHEGVDTMRTDRAFNNIKRKFTLYLSGTPFKAIASGEFDDRQIFNWSYTDEQEAKESWDGDSHNPYQDLPKLNLFTYRMSDIVREKVKKGMELYEEGMIDYAFDLNEFFKTKEDGTFEHEADVRKFLQALTTQEKFPFATEELRKEMAHTFWLLNRVDSAKALAKLLKEDGSGFKDYEVVLAAGDGRLDDNTENIKSYNKVKEAIKDHQRTITLSVGQLTTGVTIPEWSGVLMLSNMQSAQLYMQAAFRAQNPYEYSEGGKIVRKDNAYVFDFDPARTLILFDEFANNLKKDTAGGSGTTDKRQQNVRQLLNFFPVIAEDEEGRMTQIDERQVMSIPRRIKCEEVVRRGFMSNLLFRNIANIFSAPAIVGEILNKIDKAQEERGRSARTSLDDAGKLHVDGNGEVTIPEEFIIGQEQQIFGDKVYQTFEDIIEDNGIPVVAENADNVLRAIDNVSNSLKSAIEQNFIKPASEEYELTQAQTKRLVRESQKELEAKIEKIKGDFEQQRKIAQVKHEETRLQATNKKELDDAEKTFRQEMELALKGVNDAIKETTEDIINNKPKEVIERIERDKEERKKESVEDEVRAHLRGFARTIPSFIMAYDNGSLTLDNFDKNIEDEVFKEVTSISLDEFRFLRDGGDYTENGVKRHFEGHLFDEVVFDDSIVEFRNKRQELANYFDESQSEDIFDYIPPQKTNQIFTPKWVVKKMVDLLEEENPHIFDDPRKTFADLYMKSGLYITEIVRRLYNNAEICRLIPDKQERIQHILKHQVYGFAPTRIIYLIATRYILGFDPSFQPEHSNFRQVDTVPYAKEGRMEELIEREFGSDNV